MISCKALLAMVSSLHFILSVIGKSLAIFESGCAEIYFVQEKFFLTMVKDDKKGFIQEETSARGILQWGRETITKWPGHRVGAGPAGPSGKTQMPHHGLLLPVSLLS